MNQDLAQLTKLVRTIPNFPKPGIMFRDVTTLILDPWGLKTTIQLLAEHAASLKPQKIIAIESRGFVFGAAVAERIGCGLVLARKKGKLPGDTVEIVSMRFAEPGDVPEEVDPNSLPVLLGLTKAELFRIGEIAGYVLLGLLAMLLVVRPLIRRVLEASQDSEDIPPGMLTPASPGLPMVVGGAPIAELPAAPDVGMAPPTPGIESMIDIARIEGQVKASSLKKIGEIVDKHPEEAVSIIRNWLYQAA